MPDFGKELSSINFGSIIGGSLNAIVEAQSQSAHTTVDFIKKVGFQPGNEKAPPDPVYVSFRYDKEISPYKPATETEPEKAAECRKMVLEVPILTMMPIPFIRLEEATIDFNVKINSVTTTASSDTTDWNASTEANAGYNGFCFKANVKLNASFSNKKTRSNSDEVKRDYSLAIHIKVVQDDIPAGMTRLLDILDEATVSREIKASK